SFARRTTPRLATSILSMVGECSGKVRSMPTPKEDLRTVKVSRIPPPERASTTPWKTWIRERLPSTTLTCTFTVSPGRNSGMSSRSDSESMLSRMFMLLPSHGCHRSAVPCPGGSCRRSSRSACPGFEPRSPEAETVSARHDRPSLTHQRAQEKSGALECACHHVVVFGAAPDGESALASTGEPLLAVEALRPLVGLVHPEPHTLMAVPASQLQGLVHQGGGHGVAVE